MRFPLAKKPDGTSDYKLIDEPEAIRMIRYAIDNGVNYMDTAYPYHAGSSEVLLGKALLDGYREKTILATKLPVWKTDTYESFEETLDEQLSRLQTDHIDVYLFHALNAGTWKKIKDLDVFKFAEEMKRKGKIRYIGFSFHDKLPVFKEIVDSYNWDICQIQFNILDEYEQAGLEGLQYAGEHDIPVVIMEPLRGGNLANNISPDIEAAWNQMPGNKSPVYWAFRWIANFPQVLTILSGVSTIDQLKDNISIFDDCKTGSMTEDELLIVRKVQDLYKSKIRVPCTECRYCMPCPFGVSIPDIFSEYNKASIFDVWGGGRNWYKRAIRDKKDADQCTECGRCESLCPQQIEIIRMLKEAKQALTI
jgi:predicted aldo/keto reductase-like oxidoreductase